MLIIEIRENKSKEWWFRIKGINGKIIASSETYKRRAYCLRIANKVAATTSWKIREL